MQNIDREYAVNLLKQGETIVFLTGAGISTASGVPDYRSLAGVYHGLERPEYLLSYTCLVEEPEKFYSFVKTLYHPEAQPNIIHKKLAELEKSKRSWIISQNIDGLHAAANSHQLVNFHGTLYDCYCRKCQQKVPVEAYLHSDRHETCGGQIRPAIVLYEEGLDEQAVETAISVVEAADLIVIVGTSFQVHPFCDLIHYATPEATILVINQTPVFLDRAAYLLEENAVTVFENI